MEAAYQSANSQVYSHIGPPNTISGSLWARVSTGLEMSRSRRNQNLNGRDLSIGPNAMKAHSVKEANSTTSSLATVSLTLD